MNEKLHFNVNYFFSKAKALKSNISVDGVTITLPFISFNISSKDTEKKIAKELVIRLRDKRVLNSKECCKNCIDYSLKSLIEIRNLLVNKQVDIKKIDSPLFLLCDFALYGIKEFLSYIENYNLTEHREQYFEALHIIRGHLIRTFDQICIIAEVPSNFGFRSDFDPEWNEDLYKLN